MHVNRSFPRRGLTLVEVMVALVLVAVGLLGIAGSTTLLLRATTTQAAWHRATRRSVLRLARLAAAGCAEARSGAEDDPVAGLRERWRVGPVINGMAAADDSIAWTSHGRERWAIVRSALLC